MNELFVEIFRNENGDISTSIESFLVLYVYNYLRCPGDTTLVYVRHSSTPNKVQIQLSSTFVNGKNISSGENSKVNRLRLPVYSRGNTYISGLCAVCRELVKQTKDPYRKDLLGFKESCLLSPSENSVWTKFCEVDIIATLNQILHFNFENLSGADNYKIPEAISRFEAHMSQPVRVHNVYKVMQDEAKKEKISDVDARQALSDVENKENHLVKSSKTNRFDLKHRFAEGYYFTLADLILFPCFTMLFDRLPHIQKLHGRFPLIFNWFDEVSVHESTCKLLLHEMVANIPTPSVQDFCYIEEEFSRASLYKSDPKRYKPRDRIFTKQESIEESLQKLSTLQLSINSDNDHNSHDLFDWSVVEDDTFPSFGDIPQSRLERKKQQLENLASAVISLAKENDVIVDFCSGSGHLGILLAAALPQCHIIFLENKARSLARAQERVEKMNMKNCSFYQSNIDYFVGPFDLGTSLHACGTATDIVLTHCVRNRAKFVCCPCCYGSISPMPHIAYPLSDKYKTALTEKDYLFIAHCADQFHSFQSTPCNREKCLQGEFCMDAVDTDRKLMAEEAGYNVILSRLKPENCTTKNRLLIGTT